MSLVATLIVDADGLAVSDLQCAILKSEGRQIIVIINRALKHGIISFNYRPDGE